MSLKLVIATLFILSFFGIAQLNAQSSPRREVGLQFSGFNFDGSNTFSGFFKKEKKENVYSRLRFFYGNLSTQTNDGDYSLLFGSGIAVGREKRKTLDSKLQFFQGPEFSGSLNFSTVNGDNRNLGVGLRLGWVLGLQHSFNERWAINLETIPGVGLSILASQDRDTDIRFNAGISNTVSVGLVRMF